MKLIEIEIENEIEDVLFVPGTRGHLRCSCCNSVNSPEISDEMSPLTSNRMVFDPRDNTKVLCSECFEFIIETNQEFGDEDEPLGKRID